MTCYSVQDIKRLKVCPILYENKWDYSDPAKDLIPTYLYGIKEVFRWYYRRGGQITPDSIVTSISFQALQHGLDFAKKMDLELAFRKFTESGIYKDISQPHYNKEIRLNLNDKGDQIEYIAPCIFKKEKSLYFASFDLGKLSTEEFLNRYETLFQTTWSFYVCDTVPKFVNFYYENKEIKEQYFKPNLDYVKHSKERLIHLGRGIGYNKSTPPPDVCLNCNRRTECPTRNVENMLRK